MKFHKITSVFYFIISIIVYGILAISIVFLYPVVIAFHFLPPFVAIFFIGIFCIWLVMTMIKLIKKLTGASSEGEDMKGARLVVTVLFLLVNFFFALHLCHLLFLILF